MAAHWLKIAFAVVAIGFAIFAVYYAGIRWNASDEEFFHRSGLCRHTHTFCDPPGKKTW